jgi:hypothetical protein
MHFIIARIRRNSKAPHIQPIELGFTLETGMAKLPGGDDEPE